MIYLFLTLNGLLMILSPLPVVWLLKRYRKPGWGLWGMGAATFVLSQVGHIPFNNFFMQQWNPDPETDFVLVVIFLGLSSGVFEEVSRYLTYRFWAKEGRSWGQGLMLGAGHGGMEAIILGVLFLLNFGFFVTYRAGMWHDALADVPSETVAQITAAADSLFSLPWYDAILGGLERCFALCLHLSASLMVLRVFTHRQPLWLAAAIFWHAFTNSVAVYLAQQFNPYITEGFLAIVALASLAFILAVRTPEPTPPPLEPLPPLAPIQPVAVAVDRLDESRYL